MTRSIERRLKFDFMRHHGGRALPSRGDERRVKAPAHGFPAVAIQR